MVNPTCFEDCNGVQYDLTDTAPRWVAQRAKFDTHQHAPPPLVTGGAATAAPCCKGRRC